MSADWKQQNERGSVFWVRLLLSIARWFGRPVARLLLGPIVGYFWLFSPRARRASQDYLARVLARPVRMTDSLRHFHAFAATLLDRLFFYQTDADRFALTTQGLEVFEPLVARGQGALLMVAHIGSFDAMRLATRRRTDGMRVRVLMNLGQSAGFTSVLRAINPDLLEDVIDTANAGVDLVLQIREALERGEMVAVMADRLTDPREKQLSVRLLGGQVRLPALPWMLAASLGVPVIACTSLYQGGAGYALHFTPLHPGGQTILRRERSAFAQDLAQRWMQLLEAELRMAPYNWFNFFPYFDQPQAAELSAGQRQNDATAS